MSNITFYIKEGLYQQQPALKTRNHTEYAK